MRESAASGMVHARRPCSEAATRPVSVTRPAWLRDWCAPRGHRGRRSSKKILTRAGRLAVVVAGLFGYDGAFGGEANLSFDVAPGVNGGNWQALVAGAAAHSIIRFHPGNYSAGADGCNVTLRDGVRLVATMPGETVIVDCQGSGGRHFCVAEGARVVVDGLTFANGASHEHAGCVLVRAGASLEIRHS